MRSQQHCQDTHSMCMTGPNSMALQCPNCRSRSVRLDRSLGGRCVCAVCGVPMLQERRASSRQRSQSSWQRSQPIRAMSVQWRWSVSPQTLFAWLGLAGLLGSYAYLASNPQALHHWLAPYSASTRNSWWIQTPADVEVLIGKAKAGDQQMVSPSVHATIRELIARLQAKGVRVLISPNVMDGAAGVWDPGVAEVRIEPSAVAMGSTILLEILAHEAAHVAQSCRAVGLGRNSKPMGIQVFPVERFRDQLNSPLYQGHVSTKVIELEAFTVGTNPPWAIQLLDHYCKG